MSFQIGQRVVFHDRSEPVKGWFHAASMGLNGVVVHLNAKTEKGESKIITGRVLNIVQDNQGNVDIDFRPDGWLLPIGLWPQGFQVDANYLKPYAEDAPEYRATITDAVGKPVSQETIEKAVAELLNKRHG